MTVSLNTVKDKSEAVNANSLQDRKEFNKYPELFVAFGLCCALFVALRFAGIPWVFPASRFLGLYKVVAVQSLIYATVLAAIEWPHSFIVPMIERYRHSPPRLVILLLLATLFFHLFTPLVASVLLLFAIAILEIYERHSPVPALARPIIPGLYLFVGLVMVFACNAVIVANRAPSYSYVLSRVDSWILAGHSVSELSHRFCAAASPFIRNGLVVSYFGLFAQIGGGLLIISVVLGTKEGIRFVRTILVAYAITMSIFATFPSYSPYYACQNHAQSSLPNSVMEAQRGLMAQTALRRHHAPVPIDTEYYVAFPCMHIAQPLIVLWFMRKWRRILLTLIVVDFILTFAIVLLEWHYVTDLLGGVFVAALAITITSRFRNNRWAPAWKELLTTTKIAMNGN